MAGKKPESQVGGVRAERQSSSTWALGKEGYSGHNSGLGISPTRPAEVSPMGRERKEVGAVPDSSEEEETILNP